MRGVGGLEYQCHLPSIIWRPAMGDNFRLSEISPAKLADIFEQIAEMRRAKTVLPVLKSPRQGYRYRTPIGAPRGSNKREKSDA